MSIWFRNLNLRHSRQNSFAVGATPDFGDLGLTPYTPSSQRRVATPTTPHSPQLQTEQPKSNGNYFSFPPNHTSGMDLLENMTSENMTSGNMTPGKTTTGVNLNDTIYDRRDSNIV